MRVVLKALCIIPCVIFCILTVIAIFNLGALLLGDTINDDRFGIAVILALLFLLLSIILYAIVHEKWPAIHWEKWCTGIKHNYNGCKCKRCGAIRSEGHNLNHECRCSICEGIYHDFKKGPNFNPNSYEWGGADTETYHGTCSRCRAVEVTYEYRYEVHETCFGCNGTGTVSDAYVGEPFYAYCGIGTCPTCNGSGSCIVEKIKSEAKIIRPK